MEKLKRFISKTGLLALVLVGTFMVFGSKDISASSCGYFSSTDDRSGWGQEGVYLYSDDNFTGRCSFIKINQGNAWNLYVGNDHISSIRIVGSYEVIAYDGFNYSGLRGEWRTGHTNNYVTELRYYDLRSTNGSDLNDKISSIQVNMMSNCKKSNGSSQGDGIYFYSSGNRCTMLPMKRNITNDENYFYVDDLRDWYVGNDAILSMQRSGNYETRLWMDIENGGNNQSFHPSQLYQTVLSSYWRYKTSSIVVYDEGEEDYYFTGSLLSNDLRNLKWRWNASNPSSWKDETDDAIENWNNITEAISITETTGSGDVVIYIEDGIYSNVIGEMIPNCDIGNTYQACVNRQYSWVDVKSYKNTQIGWNRNERIFNITHEIGHALSLGHGDQSDSYTRVMKQGRQSIGPQSEDERRLNQRQGSV